jgi:hypothetical protein
MKIRQTYVANSSSTSFTFAIDPSHLEQDGEGMHLKQKFIVTFEVDLMRYTDHIIKSEQELLHLAQEEYCYEDLDELERMWSTENYSNTTRQKGFLQELLKQGKWICVGSASDDRGGIDAMLCEDGLKNVKNPSIIVIDAGGGY